jgi:hypothetical protein
VAWSILADAVVVLHALFVAFVVLGGLLAFRWPRVAWLQLACAAYGFLIEVVGWVCPLSPLENRFRILAGERGYAGGFVRHYLVPLLYPEPFPPWLGAALAAAVIVLNAAVYGTLFALRRRRRAGGEGER